MNSSECKKILIVDDEEDLALLLKMTFEKKGYATILANNGRAALEIVQREQVDAVVTDIRMPNGDGVEFLESVRKLNPDKPVVVMVTGFSDLTESQAYDKGAQAIFTKPVDRKAVLASIEALLEENRLASQKRHERIPSSMSISLTNIANATACIDSSTINIGRGGMFVGQTEPMPAIGNVIEFSVIVNPETGEKISGQGICKWVRLQDEGPLKKGFGLEFTTLFDGSDDVLRAIISRSNTHSHIPRG